LQLTAEGICCILRGDKKGNKTLGNFLDPRNLELVMHITTFKCYITKCTKLALGENIEVDPVHDIKTYKAPLLLDLSTRLR
jgi:hypothetical protein